MVKGSDVIFRKANLSHTSSDLDRRDRRRRGRRDGRDEPEQAADPYQPDASPPTSGGSRGTPERHGPYDLDDVEPDEAHIDLGGLLVRTVEGIELRLQVDEASESVVAALLVQDESALELRAFAAPRNAGLWDEIRREIAVETSRRGGMVTEATGPYGAEIKVVVPTQTAEGQQVTQASRIVGVDGPRWFLRGTLIGRAASEPSAAGPLLAAMSEVVVVRGKAPMAPRDMIPLRLPESIRMVPADQQG